MMATTLGNGVLMFAVHIFAPVMGEKEYGLFGALLALVNVMMIPALGLQTVFAQQAAGSKGLEGNRSLTAAVQSLLFWNFLLWACFALGVAIFQRQVMAALSISRPAALWLTVAIGLAQLWLPVLLGVLQGRQNFLWLGVATIINGAGRFISVGLLVTLMALGGTGGILGALVGFTAALLIAAWHTRDNWTDSKSGWPFDWKPWLARVVPLTLGLGASQYMLSVDMVFVRTIFGENQTGYYSASGMIGRGLVMFTAPLTVVMFPKIVQSHHSAEPSRILAYTLLSTGVLGVLAALFCTGGCLLLRHWLNHPGEIPGFLQGLLLSKFQSNQEGITIVTRLIPWFVWCMLPLTLANVLLNNLMARERYRIVPYLVLLIALYSGVVISLCDSFVKVIQCLGIFNLIFLLLTAAFSFGGDRGASASEVAPGRPRPASV